MCVHARVCVFVSACVDNTLYDNICIFIFLLSIAYAYFHIGQVSGLHVCNFSHAIIFFQENIQYFT